MQPLYKQFDQCAAQLLIALPFYGQMLARMPRKFTNDTDSLALQPHRNGYFQIAINPIFWSESLYPDQPFLQQAIQHQLLHLFFQHPLKMDSFSNRMCFSVAAEMVVLQYLDATLLLPSPNAFEELWQLVGKQSAPLEFYYHQILPYSGHPVLKSAFEENKVLIQRQSSWLGLNNIPKTNRPLLQHQWKSLFYDNDGYHSVKNIPFEFRQFVADISDKRPPIQNWRRWLRRFAGHSKQSSIGHSIRRPSKRYHSYPGLRISNIASICVAIDVSGSISDYEMQEFRTELDHLWRQQVNLRVITFDHRIQEVFDYRGIWPETFKGGGGTYYEPVFEYVKKQKRADAFVIFSDGHGIAPESRTTCPLLWVISAKGIAAKELKQLNFPGRLVGMQN